MKHIIFLSTLIFTATVFAEDLTTYDAVKSAAVTGKSLRVAVDFAQCTSIGKQLVPMMNMGVFTPDVISVMGNHVATSMLHFTLNNPIATGKPVYEFVRYTLSDDNHLALTIRVLDAATYVPYSAEWNFDCQLGVGVKIYS